MAYGPIKDLLQQHGTVRVNALFQLCHRLHLRGLLTLEHVLHSNKGHRVRTAAAVQGEGAVLAAHCPEVELHIVLIN